MPSSVRTESFRRRGDHNTRTRGAGDSEQNRPSSSGGRLEQHLGAVESVQIPSLVPSAPNASRTIGFPAGSRVAVATIGAAATNRNARGAVTEGSVKGGGRASGAPPAEHTRAFKGGGSNGASFGSSGSRLVADEPYFLSARRASDTVHQQVSGRSVRERKGGGRRRSAAEYIPSVQSLGADHIPAKGGKGDRKAGGVKTRPRRATSQISFGSSVADAGGGGREGDRRGVDRGGEATKQADRADIGTQDRKFRMQAGQSNTLVAVRLRPLLKHDREQVEVAKVLDHRVVILMDPAKVNQEVDPLRVNRTREKRYAFDYVFDATATQRAVYENTTKFLIQGVLDGFNATVFAYGCTGAGKTYTMIGNGQEGHQGIMVLTLQDLFKQQRRASEVQGRRYSVTVSFLEVYNENIRDLLNDTGEFLDLREDPIKGPTVSGLAEVEARTPEEIMDLLHQGNQSRTQQATRANAASSRSHAVLQVVVESRDKAQGTVATMHIGKLSLVDLAGSERAAATQNRGVRLVEGANINRSLLALGNCINALGERGNKGQFVPYRDSKLTRLLKDSLGGNCRTVMIANISGASSSFEETLNTLKYANRAKNIKTNATRNSLDVNHHISEYVNLIGSLRTEITRLKHQLVRGAERGGCGGGIGRVIGGEGAASTSRSSETMVFSPSLKTSKNSLFACPENDGEYQQELGAFPRGKRGESTEACTSSSRAAADVIDGNSGVIAEHSSRNAIHGGGGGDGAIAETSRGAGSFSSKRDLGPVPGGLEPLSPPLATTEVAPPSTQEDKDFVEEVREKIVENFRERMQLRRSLIELEDQNVQNSIEVGKRQLSLVEWHGGRRLPQEAASNALQGLTRHGGWAEAVAEAAEAAAGGSASGESITPPPPEVKVAWRECEQLCSAISKNNETKRKISRRLRNNSRQAEKFKADLDGKITGEDRNQLMKLQYRIGKLELDNMELEQSRIVHESAMRGKDLTIQKLQLQLAVRDRTIALQRSVLTDHGLDSTGPTDAVGVDQVGMTDALDAFLPERVVLGHVDSVGGEPIDGNIIITDDMNDASDEGDDGDQGDPIPRVGRRIGGWGSSSDSEGGDPRHAAQVAGDPENSDSAGNAAGASGAGSSALARTNQVSSSLVSLASTSPAQVAAAPVTAEQLQQQPRDSLEQMADTDVGGATGQWPNRRPSKTTSRARQTMTFQASPQPSSSLLQQKKPKQKQTRSRRRRAPSDASCGGVHSQEDHDDDSIEDGLIISSAFPARFAGGGGGTGTVSSGGGGAKVVAGGLRESDAGQTASVVVAPFHGPLPVSLVLGSGSEALPSVPAADDGRNGDKGSNGRMTDLASVRGVSIKQNAYHSNDHNHNHNQKQPPSKNKLAGSQYAGNSHVDSTISTTWDCVGERSAVVEGGGAGHPRRSERGAINSIDSDAAPPATSGVGAGGNPVNGAQSGSAQHPWPVSADVQTQQGALRGGRNVDGDFNMGISGTGVALPWRSSRRHAAAAPHAAGGANRRRLRREQTRAGANPGGVIAGLNWGSDGGFAVDARKPDVPSETSRTVPDKSLGRRQGGTGEGGDDSEMRGGPDDDGPTVARGGVHADVEATGGRGAWGRTEGEVEARSGSTKGWSAAGDSLAHLKARMGVRPQQLPTAPAASGCVGRGGGVADGESNAREGVVRDSGPHHIPYPVF